MIKKYYDFEVIELVCRFREGPNQSVLATGAGKKRCKSPARQQELQPICCEEGCPYASENISIKILRRLA